MNKEQFLEVLKELYVENYIELFCKVDLGARRKLVTSWQIRIWTISDKLRHRQIIRSTALRLGNQLEKEGVLESQVYSSKAFYPNKELFKEIEKKALEEMGVKCSELTKGALMVVKKDLMELKAKEEELLVEREKLALPLKRELETEKDWPKWEVEIDV